MRTTLALVWHMHQPYYRDMLTGDSTMPWVRLHGIHSYYDMIRMYEKYPNVKGTINFVPSLVDQLLAYTEEGKSDQFLDHTLVAAENLTPQQKAFLLRHFFMANPDRKIAPYHNYQKLFERRGLDPSHIDFAQAIRFFSTQDYLDLQVFYNLVWFGFTAKEEIPELETLLARGGHFTEDDKKFVIDSQKKILKKLLEALRRASNSQNIEITTTPYYHPIFPLLIDTNFAARANPKAPLPQQIKMPWVAEEQIKRALESMERWTGRRPRGIWPAEGSVCPEMIPIFADAGVKWMATDDRVLMLSLYSLPKAQRDLSLHQPFKVKFGGKSINMVFRDHGMSDLIGFTYSKMPAKDAVDDFLSDVKRIDEAAKSEDRLVSVILDGENPWEFFPNAGKEFLNELFQSIEREHIPTDTVEGYLSTHEPKITIETLHTGSWIDANFNIWIGKQQKNMAWNYIRRTLDEVGDSLSASKRATEERSAQAFKSFCAACGSDWFWWYDDDFDSAFKPDFDRIFRLHLKNVFSILGRDIPLFLFEPIYHFTETNGKMAEPAGFMYPAIDGIRTSFFEWANSIRFSVRGRGGAIALSAEPFDSISFGFNTEAFFLRFDPANAENGFVLAEDEELIIHLHDGNKHSKFGLRKGPAGFVLERKSSEGLPPDAPQPANWAAKDVLELAFNFKALGFSPEEEMTVAIAFDRHGVEARRYSHIHFLVPDETYEQRMWSV